MEEVQHPLFSVTDPRELMALWRLAAEAKFQRDPEDLELWDSPLVESLARRIDQALLDLARAKGPEAAERHLKWRESLSSSVWLDAVRQKLRQDAQEPRWKVLSLPEKKAYILARTAPLSADDHFLEGLVREIEA